DARSGIQDLYAAAFNTKECAESEFGFGIRDKTLTRYQRHQIAWCFEGGRIIYPWRARRKKRCRPVRDPDMNGGSLPQCSVASPIAAPPASGASSPGWLDS